MDENLKAHDGRTRRCPKLGHDLTFAYCRAPGRALPCGKVFDCWWEAFDVEGWARAHFTGDEIARILAPPPPKTATLVELIERAKRARKES